MKLLEEFNKLRRKNMNRTKLPKLILLIVLLGTVLALFGSATISAQDPTTVTFLSILADDVGFSRIIGDLAADCQADVPNVTYEREGITHDMLEQRINQLAVNDNLPTMFNNDSGPLLVELVDNGYVVNIEQAFSELGIYDMLNPAAAGLVSSLTDNRGVYAIPLELNIEGFWYNKQLFADHGLSVPETWDDMLAAAAVLHENGIQPFAVPGRATWAVTRLIAGYAARKVGVERQMCIRDSPATDPGFVEAAQAIKDLAQKGYLGVSPNTIDYGTALDQFLQGQAAMYFMGSWELRSFNDPQKTLIGMDNVGFFNMPLVDGGAGTMDDYSINVGTVASVSAARYSEDVGAWLKCVFSQYGDRAMSELGMITPFRVDNPPSELTPLTQLVLDKLASAQNAYLPFESYVNYPPANVVVSDNVQILISDDSYTAEQYMADIQRAIDEES
jgi:raffinose/stachyose/melibiose transport system substrate-binding protein